MYCFLKYMDLDPSNPDIKMESVGSLNISKQSSKTKMEYKTLLINPNCHSHILLDYICNEVQIDKNAHFDLCDSQGQLTYIKQLEPHKYATEVLVPKETYYIILFQNESRHDLSDIVYISIIEDVYGAVTTIEPLMDKSSKLYADISLKLKRHFYISSKGTLDCSHKSQQSIRSRASVSSATNSNSSKSTKLKTPTTSAVKMRKSTSMPSVK